MTDLQASPDTPQAVRLSYRDISVTRTVSPHLLAFSGFLTLALILGAPLVSSYPEFRHVNRLVGAMLIMCYLPCHFHCRLRMAPELLLFGAFVVWSAVTGLIVAVDRGVVLSLSRTLVQVWALAFALGGFSMVAKGTDVTFFGLIACALLLVCVGGFLGEGHLLVDSAVLPEGVSDADARAVSLEANSNTIGIVMVYAAIGLCHFWETKRGLRWRLTMLALAVVFSLGIVAAGSRKSFAALCVLALSWLWFCHRQSIFRRAGSLLLAVLVLVGLYCLTSYAMQNTYLGARYKGVSLESQLDTGRLAMYKRGIELFVEHPLAGVGLGNYTVVSGMGYYSHSDYIEVLSTTGLVGFALYFFLYCVLWRRLGRVARATSDGLIRYRMGLLKAALVTVLFLGLGTPQFSSLYTWYLLAGIIGYSFALERGLKRSLDPWGRLSRNFGKRKCS